MICLKQTIPLKFFKGCLPQILLGPFLKTLSHSCIFIYLLDTQPPGAKSRKLEIKCNNKSYEAKIIKLHVGYKERRPRKLAGDIGII